MVYKSPEGYVYEALELSIGAPAGLSGGPIFLPHVPYLVFGLVTGDLKSRTFLESKETVEALGHVHKTSIAAYINYGVALRLQNQSAFLDEQLPPPDSPAPQSRLREL